MSRPEAEFWSGFWSGAVSDHQAWSGSGAESGFEVVFVPDSGFESVLNSEL
jgi:hypothetical protein